MSNLSFLLPAARLTCSPQAPRQLVCDARRCCARVNPLPSMLLPPPLLLLLMLLPMLTSALLTPVRLNTPPPVAACLDGSHYVPPPCLHPCL